MHDFSQAESGWFSPFVTVSLCLAAVGSAAKGKAPLRCRAHCPGPSTPGALVPTSSQVAGCQVGACSLCGESHPGCLRPLGFCRGCGWFGRCWWAAVLCPSLAEAGMTSSGKPRCRKPLCGSVQCRSVTTHRQGGLGVPAPRESLGSCWPCKP